MDIIYILTGLYLIIAVMGAMAIFLPVYGHRLRRYIREEGIRATARVASLRVNNKGPSPRYEIHFQYTGQMGEPRHGWGNVPEAIYKQHEEKGDVNIVIHPKDPAVAFLGKGYELSASRKLIYLGLASGTFIICGALWLTWKTFS